LLPPHFARDCGTTGGRSPRRSPCWSAWAWRSPSATAGRKSPSPGDCLGPRSWPRDRGGWRRRFVVVFVGISAGAGLFVVVGVGEGPEQWPVAPPAACALRFGAHGEVFRRRRRRGRPASSLAGRPRPGPGRPRGRPNDRPGWSCPWTRTTAPGGRRRPPAGRGLRRRPRGRADGTAAPAPRSASRGEAARRRLELARAFGFGNLMGGWVG